MMEGELIIVSFISLAGMILFYILNSNQWFKRENFKIQKSNVMAENKLKLKKLAKELGVQPVSTPSTEKSFIDTLKDLDADKIKDILGMVQSDDNEGYEDENILEGALKEILANPELKEKGMKLLEDLTGKGKKEDIYEARFER